MRGSMRSTMSPPRTPLLRLALAVLSLAVVALMVLSVPSGTAMGTSSATSAGPMPHSTGTAYAPNAYMPDPQVTGNVTLNTVNLAAGQMDYPTTVGTSTTWHAPAGVSLDTAHNANPIITDNASAAVVPGVLQADAFPHTPGGFLSGGPNASAAYCSTYGAHGCGWWNNSHVWTSNDSITSTTTAGAGGMYTHITNSTSNGEPDIVISMNNSAAASSVARMTDIATAGLTIPTSALIAAGYTQTGYTYLTLSYYVTTSAAATTMVTPFIGGGYGWGAPVTPSNTPPYTISPSVYIPSSNLSTQDIVPCLKDGTLYTTFVPGTLVATKTAVAGNSACGTNTVGVPLDPMAGLTYSTQGTSGEELVSYPVSDSLYCWVSPGVTCSGLTAVTSIEFGVLIESASAVPANWVTVTVTGLALTTAPVSLGPTTSDGWTCAVASGGCAAKYGQYAGDIATLDSTVGLPTVESGVVWHNVSAPLPVEGSTIVASAGWPTGPTTSLIHGTVNASLAGFVPSWGAAGWLNGSAVTEDWYQSASVLTNVSAIPFAGPSGTGGLVNYDFHFSWPSSSDLSYIGITCASNMVGCPVDTVFVHDTAVSNTTYLTAKTDEAGTYASALFNAAANGAFPGTGTEVVRLHTQPWNPRFVVSGFIPTSCAVGHYCGPTGQDPSNATVVYSISYDAADFAAIQATLGTAPPPPPPPTSQPPSNTTGGGFLGGSISVEGTWILAGLVILVGVIVLVSWASYEGGEHKGKGMRRGGRGRRGTLRAPSLRGSRLGMAGVRHARYEGRTAKAYEHDAAGLGWFIVAAILGLGAFFWLTTSGILGFAMSQVVAAALVIVLLVVLVVLIVLWEGTKTVNG